MPWAGTSLLLLLVAIAAYLIGARSNAVEVAESGRHVWHGYGFGGFWIFLVLLWIFGGFRWMLWGSPYRHYRWRYRHYPPPWYYDDRHEWEEWHRREHERMNGRPPQPSSGSNQQPA
jgi:hypothetical protein